MIVIRLILASQNNLLEVLILIAGSVLSLTVSVVVVVVLVVEATILVEKVYVWRGANTETLTVGQLGEDLETLRVGVVVGLHVDVCV